MDRFSRLLKFFDSHLNKENIIRVAHSIITTQDSGHTAPLARKIKHASCPRIDPFSMGSNLGYCSTNVMVNYKNK